MKYAEFKFEHFISVQEYSILTDELYGGTDGTYGLNGIFYGTDTDRFEALEKGSSFSRHFDIGSYAGTRNNCEYGFSYIFPDKRHLKGEKIEIVYLVKFWDIVDFFLIIKSRLYQFQLFERK